ncbi:MAG: UDP-2,3-diacylglucosamine diphosphatase [Candidatus Krumholzibacteria bacterium]|nr:UDP-2,3-diacylglucosamine diphosphatase [Candidatus Krumholzibacteria bacterium]
MNDLKQPTAIIVADSHFHLHPDQTERRRVDRFLELLELAARADHLVLLGDIFDFWFDYPHFRLKGYDTILQGLDRVRDSGTRIHFIGGNHDIWAAGFMHQRYDCSLTGETEIIRFGNRRLRFTHGDGLLKFDWAYSSFRTVVRTRAGIVLAKSLHPEILFALSTWLSGRSRSATRDEASKIVIRAHKWLENQDAETWDLMVMGHFHHGFQIEAGSLQMACLPGWLDTLGYGLLQRDEFRLLDFDQDPLPEL